MPEEKAVSVVHLNFEVEVERAANCEVCGSSGMMRDLKLVGRNYWITACKKCVPDPVVAQEPIVTYPPKELEI